MTWMPARVRSTCSFRMPDMHRLSISKRASMDSKWPWRQIISALSFSRTCSLICWKSQHQRESSLSPRNAIEWRVLTWRIWTHSMPCQDICTTFRRAPMWCGPLSLQGNWKAQTSPSISSILAWSTVEFGEMFRSHWQFPCGSRNSSSRHPKKAPKPLSFSHALTMWKTSLENITWIARSGIFSLTSPGQSSTRFCGRKAWKWSNSLTTIRRSKRFFFCIFSNSFLPSGDWEVFYINLDLGS